MHLSGIDGLLWAATIFGNLCLAVLLLSRRFYLQFPAFTSSIILTFLSDLSLYWVLGHASSATYFRSYFAGTVLDFAVQLLVLAEVGINVFNPVRRSIPKSALLSLAGLLVASTVLSFLLAPSNTQRSFSAVSAVFLRLTLIFAILRLLVFAALAGFAQLLGVTWKNYVFQLMSGLAFSGAVSLVIEFSISRLSRQNLDVFNANFHALNSVQIAAYLGTVGFWMWAFSRNEAPRKEFTPQMHELLVTIAGTAKRTRVAVTRSSEGK